MDSLRQVEAGIRASIERSLDGLRAELADRLRSSSDEALGLLRPTALALPETFLSSEALAALEVEAGAGARRTVLAELLASMVRLDAARSQADILRALLASASGHAARAALFLAEGDGARGWSCAGFPERADLDGVSISWSANARWALLAEGRGVVTLAPADCAPLAEALSSALPAEGVLVPLVLRDRIAAVLYAERAKDERPLSVEGLQILTYLAALALETLPFRERAATPTLESGAGSGARGLPLWESGEEPEPAPAPASAPAVPAADAVPAPSSGRSPGPAELGVKSSVEDVEELLFGDAPAAAAPAAARSREPEPAADLESLPELVLEPLPEFEAVDLDLESELPPVPSRPSSSLGPPPGAETVRVPLASIPPPPAPPAGTPVGSGTVTSAIDLSEDDTLLLQRSRADARAAVPAASPPSTGPVAMPLPPVPVPPRKAFEGDETFPGMARTFPPAAPAAPAAPVNSRSTAEVNAPSDVRGPGKAFATRPQGLPGLGGEASHEEARRLAKLLVSEIKLYNEDQIDAGRRGSDIYARLKEDIERSRQMYEERIDPRVRAQNDYFQQELVRILAGGDARALGA